MKKIAAILAITASASTFAQVTNFTGWSAGVNLDHSSMSNQITDATSDMNGLGQQTVGASLQAAYGIALSNLTVLNIGGTYGLNNTKAGFIRDGSRVTQMKGKDAYSLYIEPGYLVSEKTLAYAKLSYEAVKGTIESTNTAIEGSRNLNGTGYGFGMRTMLDKSWSLQAEVKRVNFGSKAIDTVNVKTTATVGSIGIGYKF